ncbi:MAG TPA: amidase family protein, partial [Nocardioides sp.]|uniref:amidase family protein n=1 Tax=Nocardioides sp. TaxID=35761 RepID=UPI002F429405
MSEPHDLTALEQGDAVRRGEVSPRELAEHYVARADDVGAFVTHTTELALERADSLLPVPEEAGPLYGVPTAIKDLNLTAGVRTTFGSAAFADYVPDVSDAVTLAIEAAGMVSLGKTNTPE